MSHQLEIKKRLEKGQLVMFNIGYQSQNRMNRREDVVKGKEYTAYPHPPPSKSNYRDINPSNRVRPESNQGCKQDYVVRGNAKEVGTDIPPPHPKPPFSSK